MLTVSLVKALSNVKVWILADSVCWVMTFYVSLGIQRGQWSDGKLIEIVFALLLHPFFNPHIFSPLQALHKCTTFVADGFRAEKGEFWRYKWGLLEKEK